MTRFSMTSVTDAAQWAEFLARVEHPHMVQSWAYGAAKEALGADQTRRRVDIGGWRVRRLVIELDGAPVAMCQLLDKRFARYRVASRLNRGPLFLDAQPGDDVVRDVYRGLRESSQRRHGPLVLAPALTADPDNYRLLQELGYRPRSGGGWCSYRVDLRGGEEQIRKNLKSTWRNRLRAAERAGLEVRVSQSPDDVRWMLERHAENMQAKGFSHPAPALVRALCDAAPDDVLVFQALLEEETVAGMLVFLFGRGAEFYVGWMSHRGREVNVGNFLYYQVALELHRRGRQWCDLCGERSGATEQFKRGMRGEHYELLNDWVAF